MNTWAVPGYTESLELGSGASGRVVLAVHRETGIPVAVKYLSESLHTRPGFVHDFRAEARLLAGLDSPYVTGLYEYVESPDGAAIVMELVDGVSLRSLLTRQSPLDPEAALVILKGSLLGLADAHRLGVVHRDYKPENVLVRPDGESKLVDFGIAVSTGESAGVAGTPSYMAPEQWTGAPASPASDVYAATATFFECLTGHKPYPADNLAELALRHIDSPVPAEEVPEPVRSLVRRGLAKSPAERPAHAEAFVADLEAAAVAGYGPQWEERGRGRLAALAALLVLLRPPVRPRAETTTDTARTVLRSGVGGGGGWGHAWRPTRPGLLVSAAAALLAIVLAYGMPRSDSAAADQAAEAFATTSAQPGVESGPTSTASPASSSSPAESPAPAGSSGASPSGSLGSASDDPAETSSPPAQEATPTGGATATPTPTTASPTAPVAPAVKDVAVSGFRQTGPTTGTTTVSVSTDGTGPISVTLVWYTGDTSGQPGTPDATPQTFDRSGATQYTFTVDHTFQGKGCYWAVQATTTPASADGGASQQILTRRCDIR
ncbi:serine/threonine-protein kinase [Streptomyces sp. Qhu-G9]|uniref:serine/threonine-protein kinase n=1 Tax=Streptomyces sp. Qhu-G9 TaxID=3452799 RepID=UPI0022AC85F8|nr:serine/threonine-protein kinase [Streptomyces aurantiacus]WAU81850.1 serine/threonine-protein kinase [Streptomyces aurantiacus]